MNMNSIYKAALLKFIQYSFTNDIGPQKHWNSEASLQMIADAYVPRDSLELKSLRVEDFKWL